MFTDIRISNIKDHIQFSNGANRFGIEYLGGSTHCITISLGTNDLEIEWPQKPPKPTISVYLPLKMRHFTFLNKQYSVYFGRLALKPQYCFSVLYIWSHEERTAFINLGDRQINIIWRVVLSKRWFKKERQEFIKGLKKQMVYETQEYVESLRHHDEFMVKSYLQRQKTINKMKEIIERESQKAENSEND